MRLRSARALQVVQERALKGSFGRALEGLDLAQVAADGACSSRNGHVHSASSGKELAKTYSGRDQTALALTVRTGVALVQPPPRGIWGKGGRALHTSIEAWLGRSPGPAIALEDAGPALPRRVRPREREGRPGLVAA